MLNEESPSGALGSRHDKIDAPSITSSNAADTSKRFVVEPSIEAARQLLGTVVKLPAGKYDGFGEEEQTRYATYTEPLQWLLARLLSQCTVPGGEWEVEPRGSRPLDDDPETLTQLEVVLRPAAGAGADPDPAAGRLHGSDPVHRAARSRRWARPEELPKSSACGELQKALFVQARARRGDGEVRVLPQRQRRSFARQR